MLKKLMRKNQPSCRSQFPGAELAEEKHLLSNCSSFRIVFCDMSARFRRLVLLLSLAIVSSVMAVPAGFSDFPKTILWAWDRAEDVRFLPASAGVADEAVPMLFRLGPERETFRRLAACDHEFREHLCRSSFGFSTDEAGLSSCGKRVYWFSPVPWTSALFSRTGESK